MVGGKGALGEALSGKHHKSDIVVGAIANEFLSYLHSRNKAIGLQVHGHHTAGCIYGEHNIYPLHIVFLPTIGVLWAC